MNGCVEYDFFQTFDCINSILIKPDVKFLSFTPFNIAEMPIKEPKSMFLHSESIHDSRRPQLKCKLLTGTYILHGNRAAINQYQVNATSK